MASISVSKKLSVVYVISSVEGDFNGFLDNFTFVLAYCSLT